MATRQQRRPRPRLAGVSEVADQLYITKSALADRRRNRDFPQPLAELACGPIWDLADIEAYEARRDEDPHTAYRWHNQPSRRY